MSNNRSITLVLALLASLFAGPARAQQVTSALTDSTPITGSAGTTSTITGVNVGSAFAGRVLCALLGNAAGLVPTGVTVGGVAASLVNEATIGGTLACAVVPTGTTVTIVVTLPSSTTANSNGMIALSGAASATPAFSSAVGAVSTTLNVPANGSVIGYAGSSSVGTWSGVNQLLALTGAGATAGSFDNTGGAITGRTVGYSTAIAMIVASFTAATPSASSPHLPLLGAGH